MKPLGIVAALPAEAQCLSGLIDHASDVSTGAPKASHQDSIQQLSKHVLLLISGIGAERAARASDVLIKHGVGALMSWGCAGALSPDLQPGDLLLPQMILSQVISFQTVPSQVTPLKTVLSQASEMMHVDQQWHACLLAQYPKASTGILAESATVLTEPIQKAAFHQSSGAVAVDMESAAVARAARDAQIPFIAIRAIVDNVETHIPACVHACVDAYGKLHPLKLLQSMLTHPSILPRLLQLGRQFHAARATLSGIANAENSGLLEPVTRSGMTTHHAEE